MPFIISNCRQKYNDGEIPLLAEPIGKRISKAAFCFCHEGSIRNWRSDSTMRAIMDGYCRFHEFYTFEKRARNMQKCLSNSRI